MQNPDASASDGILVKFNVGGVLFMTKTQTLQSALQIEPKHNLLNLVVNESSSSKESVIFVDRDPQTFQWILNYFRRTYLYYHEVLLLYKN